MSRRERTPLHEAETKVIFEGIEPGTYIHYFKDAAHIDNKVHLVHGKGVVDNRLSELVMVRLGAMGIPTHFVRRLNMREQVVKALDVFKIRIIVRNVAAGSFVTRFGIDEGTFLPRPVLEFLWKNQQNVSQYVSEEHINAFGWAALGEIEEMMGLSLRVNDFLTGVFFGLGIQLVDCVLHFGRCYGGDYGEESRVVLVDGVTPDCCRLVDSGSLQKFDRANPQCFSQDSRFGYEEIGRRFGLYGSPMVSHQ